MAERMTAADLAAIVRELIARAQLDEPWGRTIESRERYRALIEAADAANDALLARCEAAEGYIVHAHARAEAAERERDEWKATAEYVRSKRHIAETRVAELHDRCEEAERQRDASQERITTYSNEVVDRLIAAEARVAELEQALRPFGTGVEAFDRSESTYGDGPVFQRINGDAVWSFTVADARRARAALAPKADA